MNRKNISFIIGILFLSLSAHAQVAMGKWRTHFAYNVAEQVAQSENKVFVVSEGKLFSVDKRDGSMEFYSKLSGLNGIIISKIEYDDTNKTLLIVYDDGNIDFLSAAGVKNLPDFYNKQMSADKGVNHILFYNNKAYLSCNFGIIALNMLKMEIQDTYYIGSNASEVKILNTTIHGGSIYAVTASGIYFASASEPHLINYEFWKTKTGLPGSGNYQALFSFGDKLVLLRGGKLYLQASDGVWSNLDTSTNYTGIVVSGNYLQAYTSADVFVFDRQLVKNQITGVSNIKDGKYDSATSKFWFAARGLGLAEYQINGSTPTVNYHKPDGPVVNMAFRMQFAGERLIVVPGGKWLNPIETPGNIMIFEDNRWKNILRAEIEKSLNGIEIKNLSAIAIDPDDKKHFYITSANSGIYEFRNDELFQHFDYTNSNIEKASGLSGYYYQRTDNGTLDADKNLWITNDLCASGIKIMKSNGEWTKLDYEGLRNKQGLGKILFSNQNRNQKWALSRVHGPGICIFDDNGTIDNSSDDKSVFLQSFNYLTSDGIKTITPEFFFSIEQEKNGAIWVGTSEGPLLFSNPSKAFDPDFTCTRVIIPRNDGTGLGDYLLEDQNVWAIAIDGANRKWFGTERTGVYLMSENGQETIYHFTTANSPLISNNIQSIGISPVTGEVFFGTGNGLLSFQSDAAYAEDTFNNVHAYPNPVRENFTGLITITGLVEDTHVKITDTAGNLVFETSSKGSIATWDGKNKYGRKVSTGVYVALCVSPDGQQSATVKIMIIN